MDAEMDAVHGVALRGICALYFENHVSPMMQMLQKQQGAFETQLKELQTRLEDKANAKEVPTLAAFQDVSARSEWMNGTNAVQTLTRLQNLSSSMEKKANCSDVPSIAQLRKLADQASELEKKLAATSESVAALERKADKAKPGSKGRPTDQVAASAELEAAVSRLEELAAGLDRKADAADAVRPQDLRALREELLLAAKTAAPSSSPSQDGQMKKVQVIVAAAASRFEKQLKEVRSQIKDLQESRQQGVLGTSDIPDDERWPGRRLGPESPRPASDAGSDLQAPSDLGSMAGSTYGLSPEDKAELRRIQTIVGAAGTAFSKEMKQLKETVREMREELHAVKGRLGS